MESVNTNTFYIQNSIGVNVTFLHGLVALVILGLLSGFPRLHYDTPYSVGSLSSRDRLFPEISDNTKHTPVPRRDSNIQTQQASDRGDRSELQGSIILKESLPSQYAFM